MTQTKTVTPHEVQNRNCPK